MQRNSKLIGLADQQRAAMREFSGFKSVWIFDDCADERAAAFNLDKAASFAGDAVTDYIVVG